MADVTVKTIETRLQLKYDTYANWTNADLGENKGANLVLLKGEIGIVEIEAKRANDPTVQTPAPTVLFKVGDGEHKFSELNWASALAADVYAWAKAEKVELVVDTEVVDGKTVETGRRIVFKTGETEVDSIDLSAFATDAEVAALTAALDARIAAIEGALGTDNGAAGSVSARLDSAETKLDDILGHEAEGETEAKVGLIDQALADAKAYTNEVVGTAAVGNEGDDNYAAATGIRKEIADAQAAAIAAANANTATEVGKLNAKDAELAGEITRVEGLVTTEATNRENADKAITDVIGEGFEATATGTVAAKVKAAQDAADAAQADVDALTAADGAVTKNTADIAQLTTDLGTETTERKAADEALDNRLKEVEAFFEGAKEDSEGLNDALDKLVDIQTYLTGDGSAAGDLVGQVSANAQAIKTLQDTLAEGGDFEKRVAAVEASASANAGDIKTLQDLTAGDYGDGTIKDAIDAAAAKGQQGIDNAATAKAAADAAQKDVDDLATIVGKEAVGTAGQEGYEEATGLVKVINDTNATATDAQARVAAVEPRIEQAEKDIDALEAIVKTGENTNAQLRADIEALEAIVVTGADANVTLGGEIDAIAAKVNHETTGLAATKKIADDNAADIAEIKADYLKSTDVFVFQCGSSTTVTHTVPVTPAE